MPKTTNKPIEPIKPARWYKGEKFQYELNLEGKGKVTGYFKTIAGRYGGRRTVYRYYKCHENGILFYVDLTLFKTGVNQSLQTPYNFQPSTKREFETAFKKYLKLIS